MTSARKPGRPQGPPFGTQPFGSGPAQFWFLHKVQKQAQNPNATAALKPLDTSGKLPSGESFDNFRGLQQILIKSQRRTVIENIVKRTLSYALARELNVNDMPTVDAICSELDRHGNLNLQEGTYHDLIHLVANSLPFTHAQPQHIKHD